MEVFFRKQIFHEEEELIEFQRSFICDPENYKIKINLKVD